MLLLCYHKVGEVERWLNVGPETLRRQIRMFRRRGYGFRTARAAPLRESRTVQLHFDDAYASALNAGREVLDLEGVPGTFWAVPSEVGGISRWDGDRAATLAEWPELTQAQSDGHEVGNHTRTHPHLPHLTEAEQIAEIVEARDELARRGFLTDSICYPYGDFDSRMPAVLAEAGVKVGFSLAKRPCRESDLLWALPRIAVAFSDSPVKLLYKIHIRPHLP